MIHGTKKREEYTLSYTSRKLKTHSPPLAVAASPTKITRKDDDGDDDDDDDDEGTPPPPTPKKKTLEHQQIITSLYIN